MTLWLDVDAISRLAALRDFHPEFGTVSACAQKPPSGPCFFVKLIVIGSQRAPMSVKEVARVLARLDVA